MMTIDGTGRLAAGAIAGLGWFALALQLVLIVSAVTKAGGTAGLAVLNYLSFFTILTNILVAWVMTRVALAQPPGAATLGGATLHIAVVGLVYSAVLRAIWDPQGWQKVADMALHDAVPALAVLFWLIAVPKGRLSWRNVAAWLAYPLAFLAWSMARGAVDGWYPYPFLDAGRLGYAAAGRNAAAVTALFLILGLGLVGLDKALGRRRSP